MRPKMVFTSLKTVFMLFVYGYRRGMFWETAPFQMWPASSCGFVEGANATRICRSSVRPFTLSCEVSHLYM